MNWINLRSVLKQGPIYLALLSFNLELYSQDLKTWGVESQTKSEIAIQPDADLERARVTIKRQRVESKEPSIRRESIAFDEALRYKRLQKTEELVKQLEQLILKSGQSPRRGELQMRLAELYFERSKDMASQEGESWRKEVEKWEALEPSERSSAQRPILKTPKANVYRRQALGLYNDLEKRSRGADAGRSQMIQREEVLFYLGMTFVEVGEGTKAERPLEELLNKYPSSPRSFATRLQLADLYFERGAFAKATPLYLRLGSEKSSPELAAQVKPYIFYKLGWCYFNTAAYEKAILAYKKTVELAEQGGASSLSFNREAERDLARTFALAGQYQEGIDYFKRRDKDLLREHLKNSADLSASRGQIQLSLKFYADLIQDEPNALEARDFAMARLELIQQSRSSEKMILELKNMAIHFGADSSWMKARESSERSNYIEELVAMIRREAKAIHQAAQKSRQSSRFESARPYYELYFSNVPKPNPDSKPNLHEMKFYYAELLYRLKEFNRADQLYADVGEGKYSANAAYARILTLKELVATDKNKSRDLKKATDNFIKQFPEDTRGADLLYASAFASYNAADKETSKETLEEIMVQYANSETGFKAAERYLFLLEEEGNLKEALKGVDKLSKNGPLMKAHASTLSPRIASFKEKVNFKNVELMPETSQSHLSKKAQSFFELSPSLSRSLQEKALNNALVYSNRAQNKELSTAVSAELIKKFPKSSLSKSIYLEQGESFARSGDWSQSLASYNKFLSLSAQDKNLAKSDHESAIWNKILIQSHLENQVGIKIARKNNPSADLKKSWNELFTLYPKSKFRSDVLEFVAYANTVQLAEVNNGFGLPALNRNEKEVLEEAKTLLILRNTKLNQRSEVLKVWNAAKVKNLIWEMRRVFALWAFESLEPDFLTYSKMKFNFNPKQFAASLNNRTKALEAIEKKYLNVVSYGDGDTALKSLNRMALAYKTFALDLSQAPLPPEELKEFVKPFEMKSQQILEDCLSKAIEFKIAGSGLNECRTQLMRISPQSYVLTHEKLLSPGFVSIPPVSDNSSKLWELAEKSLRANREGEFFLSLKVARGEMQAGRIPKDWEFYFTNLEGLQAWREGSNEWAAKKFREAIDIKGDQHRELRRVVAMNLAAIHLNLGDFAEATALMEGLSRTNAEAALLAGVALVGQSKFEAGAEIFDEASSEFKNNSELLFHAALAWKKAGNSKKAIDRMTKFIEKAAPSTKDISRQLLKEWRGS